ncbi:SDR family oxidoreductase [soil metagenome]
MNDIQDKVVVITGASSGLGEATARHLASLGAKVVLGARRTDRIDAIVADIEASGGQAIAVAVDVTRRTEVQSLVDAAVTRFGRVDVFVNNAGLMALAPLAKGMVDEWDRMIDINIKGVLYGIAAALPQMQRQGSGHIVNVASIAGHKVFTPIGTVYSATKHAVRAISEGLRVEAEHGIRTTIISPGAVQSELSSGSSDGDTRAAVESWYAANQIPADSVARAIAYAIEQPPTVDVNEILVRPVSQEF